MKTKKKNERPELSNSVTENIKLNTKNNNQGVCSSELLARGSLPLVVRLCDVVSDFRIEAKVPDFNNGGKPMTIKDHPAVIQCIIDSLAFEVYGANYDPNLALRVRESLASQSEKKCSQTES